MKKWILKKLGLYPIGYEQPNVTDPKAYVLAKGIELPVRKQKTLTHPIGETKPFNEVFSK